MMKENCDFYVMGHDGKLEWIGSVFTKGELSEIPVLLLLETNEDMFRSRVSDFISENDGVCKYNGEGWPWDFPNSSYTDNTYIYHQCTGKVYMSISGGRLVDPIDLIQGMDLIGADIGMGKVKFPDFDIKTEEHGSKPAKVI